MAQEHFDYSAMLADARAKRAALDAFITSLENAQALGALGQTGTGSVTGGGGASMSRTPVELPVGALRNKSVSSAIRLYLAACVKKQTVREISDGLKNGGVVSTSKNFDVIVYNTLRILKNAGVALQYADGWGLAEHVPEAIRSRMAQQESASKKSAKKAKRKTRKQPVAKAKPAPASQADIKVQEMPKAS
jgi:hypothetical protein